MQNLEKELFSKAIINNDNKKHNRLAFHHTLRFKTDKIRRRNDTLLARHKLPRSAPVLTLTDQQEKCENCALQSLYLIFYTKAKQKCLTMAWTCKRYIFTAYSNKHLLWGQKRWILSMSKVCTSGPKWLWRPGHIIHIIFIFIKPFSDLSCPERNHLHLLSFSRFSFCPSPFRITASGNDCSNP